MEKVIKEFEIVETDDGFRIEIKGDKETIRQMLENAGPQRFFGGKSPFGGGPIFWDWLGGWCSFWEETAEKKKSA